MLRWITKEANITLRVSLALLVEFLLQALSLMIEKERSLAKLVRESRCGSFSSSFVVNACTLDCSCISLLKIPAQDVRKALAQSPFWSLVLIVIIRPASHALDVALSLKVVHFR